MAASFASREASASYHDRQAEALARLLRQSPLTLLLGAAGSGKTAVLTDLLSRLARRAADRTPTRVGLERAVLHVPERRRLAAIRDVAVYFDGWNDAPLVALGGRIDEALFAQCGVRSDQAMPDGSNEWLAAKLESSSRRSNVRFLIVLDGFESHLGAFADHPGIVAFDEALVAALVRRAPPAHFLIACRDDAEPALERLRARIGDLADGSLRMRVPDDPHDEANDVARFHVDPGPWDALEEEQRDALRQALHDESAGDGSMSLRSDPPIAPFAIGPEPGPQSASDAPRRPRSAQRAVLVAGVAVVLVGAAIARFAGSSSQTDLRPAAIKPSMDRAVAIEGRSASGASAPALPTSLPKPVGPAFVMQVDADSGTEARIAAELRERVATDAGIDLRVRASSPWSDGFEQADGPTRLAILRYDALQAARGADGRAGLPQILTPLHTEAIFVVARRDAPMTFIHEIEGRRINVGPETSERGLTGARLYRNLFGRSPSVAQMSFDDQASALATLVEDRGLDAVVVVGTELNELFTGRAAAWRSRVKLLRVDRENPTTRRAQRFFLTSVARGEAGAGLLDADTPVFAELAFLVTSGPADDAHAVDLAVLARSLCTNLPELQRDGHPKWREVRIGTRFEVGLPYAPAAVEAFRACEAASAQLPQR